MAKKLLIFSLSLLALIFTACSSDSEDAMGTSGMHEYSVEEIQQIQKLQEEYGVSFEFPTKSQEALPTVKDMEELCQLIACSNHSKSTVVKQDGILVCTKGFQRPKSRSWNGCTEYSGEYHGSTSYYDNGSECIIVKYKAKWSGTNSSGCGDLSIYDIDYEARSEWSVEYKGLKTEYEGGAGVRVIFKFNATKKNMTIQGLEVVDHLSLNWSNH